ncbi:MAG: glycosyltransferase family 39 protein [Planctomycetota bacterium]|nr:glycosyltransferase family 39 protein [Planctomycetota bacterium]
MDNQSAKRLPAELGLLLLLTAAGLFLRWIDIHRSLWLDELHTSWCVSGTLSEVAERASDGNQSPGYFYLVWSVISLLGQQEWSLRLVSLVSGTLLVPLSWQVCRQLGVNSWLSLLAAAMIAVDPFFIEYSQEARPYALIQLLALMQIRFFVYRIDRFPWEANQAASAKWSDGNRIGWVVTGALLFQLHVTTALLSLGMFLFLVGNFLTGDTRIRWKHLGLLLDFVVLSVICTPLLGHLLRISERRQNWDLFVNDYFYSDSLTYQLSIYFLPAVLLIVIARFTHSLQKKELRPVLALAACYLLPILLAWYSLKTGWAALYHQRYFLSGWPASILLIALSWQVLACRTWNWKPAIMLLAIGWSLFGGLYQNHLLQYLVANRFQQMPFESPWREAIESLNEDPAAGPIYLFPNLIEDRTLGSVGQTNAPGKRLLAYCCFPVRGIYRLASDQVMPRPTLDRPRFQPGDIGALEESGEAVLLIRGGQPQISEILNEFAQFGERNALLIRDKPLEKRFPVRGAPGNAISIFRFSIGKAAPRSP